MKMLKVAAAAAALATTALTSTAASAATLIINLDGEFTFDEWGDPDNTILSRFIGANSIVKAISYDVTIFADDPSWLSEVMIAISDSSFMNGGLLTPGFGDDFPGTFTYSDSFVLGDFGAEFAVGADGLLLVELFEDYDDYTDDWDARFEPGSTLTIEYELAAPVPEPGTWAMMIGGFGMMGGLMRRRRPATTVSVTYS